MKKILFSAVCLFVFSGCSQVYDTAKPVYKGVTTVVNDNKDLVSDDTWDWLVDIYNWFGRYDNARTTIKKSLKESADTNSSNSQNIE